MYLLSDLYLSEKVVIPEDSCIVLVVNDNAKYFSFLQNLVKSIMILHDVKIIVLTINCEELLTNHILYETINEFPSKITVKSIKFENLKINAVENFSKGLLPIQFLKPFALRFLLNESEVSEKNILYLDVDIFPLRRLDVLFDYIVEKPLIVTELGIEYEKLNNGYHNFLNRSEVYRYFNNIPGNQRWPVGPPPNSGVIGFNKERDYELINEWYEITKYVCENPVLMPYISWWDQGTLILALERLRLIKLPTSNTLLNKTILIEDKTRYSNLDLSSEPAHLVHFIGTHKFNIISNIGEKFNKLDEDIKISILYNNKKDLENIHPRKYLNFIDLNNLSPIPKFDKYYLDGLDIFKIFISKHNILDNDCSVVGCVLPTFNKSYGTKIDHLYNWYQYKYIKNLVDNTEIVFCHSKCWGLHSQSEDPTWKKNFQQHFRQEFSDSEWVEEKLYKITGLKYDGIKQAPYGNQVICNKNLFIQLQEYAQEYIPKVIEQFGENPDYNVPNKDISLGYILEELILLWWSNKSCVNFLTI